MVPAGHPRLSETPKPEPAGSQSGTLPAPLRSAASRHALRGAGLAGLFVAAGTFRGSQNMAQTSMSLLARSLGLDGAAIGALSAGSNLVGIGVMLLFTARVAPTSARRVVAAGSALLAAALALFVLDSRQSLLGAALLLGAAGGLATPAMATAFGHRAGARTTSSRGGGLDATRALMLFGLVLSLSLSLGPLAESAVLAAAHQNLRVAFLAFLPVALLGAYAVGIGAPVGRPEPRRRLHLGRGLSVLFTNRRAALGMCAQALYAVPFSLVVVFGALVGRSLFHASASEAEVAIATFFASSLGARGLLSWRPVVGRRVNVFALCIALTLSGLGLLATGSATWVYFVALAILGVPHGLTYPLSLALLTEAVSRDDLARANASFAAVSALINVVAPLGLGAVVDAFGDRTMVASCAVPVVALAVVLARLRDAEAPTAVAR